MEPQYNAIRQELDSIMGTTTRIPRLLFAKGFLEWKYRIEKYIKMKHFKIWRNNLRGPVRITNTPEDGTIIEKEVQDYTDADFDKIEEQEKALTTLTMALSPVITQGFREYDSTMALWEVLNEIYEGNEDMKQSRQDMLR
uniref:Uncharacterized protein n=1 Tax=Lactuca sativa TaxID=4236 RepID=A0A9R1XAE8_LACSA|nr:hypothetical protein LSAT_V11C500243530 [Lactuca sativa]